MEIDNSMSLNGNFVSISDFSRGKTSKVFDDVKSNGAKYIVLKNNQPVGVILSPEKYRELIEKAVCYTVK